MERNIEFALLSRRRKRSQAILMIVVIGLIVLAALILFFLPHFASLSTESNIVDLSKLEGEVDIFDPSPSIDQATLCNPPTEQTVLMVDTLLSHPVLGLEADVFSKQVLVDKCAADITSLIDKYRIHVELLFDEYLTLFRSGADDEALLLLESIGKISPLNADYESLHASLLSSRADAIITRERANNQIAREDFLSGLISLRQLVSVNGGFYDYRNEVARIVTLAEKQVVENGRRRLAAASDTKSLGELSADLKVAKSHLSESAVISQLETEVEIKKIQIQVTELIALANELIEIGSYEESLVIIQKVKAADKTNKRALELEVFVEERRSHLNKLKGLIAEPTRLLDQRIAEYAYTLLTSSSFSEESRVIAAAESKLAALLVWANEMVTLNLVALRPLEVEVRGVGYAKNFSNKKIQLKRASYILFARCDGHSDRRYEIDFIDTDFYSLEVDCGNELR